MKQSSTKESTHSSYLHRAVEKHGFILLSSAPVSHAWDRAVPRGYKFGFRQLEGRPPEGVP